MESEKGFWLCCRSILFIMTSELKFVKRVRFFEWDYIVKWVAIFNASFCRLWDFLLENRKLQIWRFESFIFGPSFVFWGLFKGVLVRVKLNFLSFPHPTPPNIKLPTVLSGNDLCCLLVLLPQEIQDLSYNISMAFFLTIHSLSD